jgi:hypothetical protein
VTLVLADDVLREYADDLLERHRTYRALIDDGCLVLTQNRGFEDFERTLKDAGVERLVAEQATLSPVAVRERNLRLMEQLNPGRIFHIRLPVDEVVRRWVASVRPTDRAGMDTKRQLELVNLMLPTRLFISQLDLDVAPQLAALVRRCPQGAIEQRSLDDLSKAFSQLLTLVTRYLSCAQRQLAIRRIHGDLSGWHTQRLYEVSRARDSRVSDASRRALTTHQRTKTIDLFL